MERIYTIPLRDVKNAPRTKRAKHAVAYIRRFVQKHMKNENVKIDGSLNEKVWERGIRSLPARIKVKAETQDDGSVLVTPA
ncbi:MAG: 50S ribosomal protein L31e [Euryarchaeota archaeon]|nr:50S ribosomal protein L31e [Euryarchaeota archaeon]